MGCRGIFTLTKRKDAMMAETWEQRPDPSRQLAKERGVQKFKLSLQALIVKPQALVQGSCGQFAVAFQPVDPMPSVGGQLLTI